MPYPFVVGETLGAVELNAALDMRMLSSGVGLAFTPGALLFGGAAGGFQTDAGNLFWDDTNNRLAVRGPSAGPQATLHVGNSAGTMRVYNQWTDTANAAWGEFSWASDVLYIGSNKLGAGLARDVVLRHGGGADRLRITSTGVTATGGITQTQPVPVLLGTAALALATRGVCVMGNYAYTTCTAVSPAHTLEIWDITVPTLPVKVGGLDFPATALGNPVVAGNILYSACNLAANGLQVIDISNPKAPVRLHQSSTAGAVVAVSGAYLYQIFSSTSASFRILDISDPTVPITKSTISLTGASGGGAIVLQGKYAYVAMTQGVGGVAGLYVIDISDPITPVVIDTYNCVSNPRGLAIAGRYLYVSEATAANGLEVIDTQDPTNLVQIAVVATAGNSNSYVNPIVAGRYLYHANGSNIQVLDIINPAAPVFIGTITIGTSIGGMVLSGNRLYVNGLAMLRIYDTYGVETPSLGAGSIQADRLYVDGPSHFEGDMYAQRGLIVGQAGIFSRGPICSDASEAAVPISAIFGTGLVCIGGNSSAFPALKRSAAILQVRQGDDSAYAGLEAATLTAGSAAAVTGSHIEVNTSTSSVYTSLNAAIGARMAIYNSDLTDGNISRLMFSSANTTPALVNNASICGVHLSHLAAAETTALTFQTRHLGAHAERGRITGTGWGIGSNFLGKEPQAMLHVGSTAAATARSYHTFTDAANGTWAYMGDWVKSTDVATYGTDKNGTGVARAVNIVAGGITGLLLTDTARVSVPLAFGLLYATPAVPFDMRGTFTTGFESVAMNVTTTFSSPVTGEQYFCSFTPTISPTGSSTIGYVSGFRCSPFFGGTTRIDWLSALHCALNMGLYSGSNPTYQFTLYVGPPTGLTSTKYSPVYTGCYINGGANAHGASYNPVYNNGLSVDGSTSGPAAGGIIQNTSVNITMPTGSGAGGTANIGLGIAGNGGAAGGGGTSNWAILNSGTAPCVMGNLIAGTNAATPNPTNATSPFLYCTVVAGTPTGIPAHNATGYAAIQWDSTGKKLWVFDYPTGTWKGATHT